MFVDINSFAKGCKMVGSVYISTMADFNFNEPADLFVGGSIRNRRAPMTFRRFAIGAEAVRYAIEMQPEANLVASVVEAEENRFVGAEIRRLYESEDYPLARRQP
jgi:hypothetical protein